MRIVEPKVFLMGESRIRSEGLRAYLKHIGVPEWSSDAVTDPEKIIEIYGRLCYRSFKPGLNPNVTKIREHNDEYIKNILNVRHGSVIEHSFFNFIFADVSRVFTHELIRHRVGRRYDDRDELEDTGLFEFITVGLDTVEDAAISQESLRYVRFDNVGFWIPSIIVNNPEARQLFLDKLGLDEEYQLKMTKVLGIEEMKSFETKKEATSAMRRIVSMGVATTVGWTANTRTVRNCLELRTHPGAEEEIRVTFGQVGRLVVDNYKNLFGDYEVEIVKGLPYFKTLNVKV